MFIIALEFIIFPFFFFFFKLYYKYRKMSITRIKNDKTILMMLQIRR